MAQWHHYDIETSRPTHGVSFDRRTFLGTIQSKFEEYEAEYHLLKEATTVLELALWKKGIDVNQAVAKRER